MESSVYIDEFSIIAEFGPPRFRADAAFSGSENRTAASWAAVKALSKEKSWRRRFPWCPSGADPSSDSRQKADTLVQAVAQTVTMRGVTKCESVVIPGSDSGKA